MYSLVVLSPLLGAAIAGALCFVAVDPEDKAKKAAIDRLSQIATIGGMSISTIVAFFILKDVVIGHNPHTVELFNWIDSGALKISWALKLDTLSSVMLMMVSFVATLIHIYSVGYMSHDNAVPRFFSYLSLFTFSMLMLVSADNLVQMFFGWEGVGLCSYLLIGFWYEKPSACAAAIKAFVVNRVGDFGFMLGIFLVFVMFQTVSFETIFAAAGSKSAATITVFSGEFHALTVACLLLFVGAMGKSAQIGLHTWLPDAMEGPTPVSALIHAATMVTAGVFMVARLSPLFEYSQTALDVVTIVGASTAFFAATIGCVQNDIKRVIAYSTCSQLGYMFFALGVSAYAGGIFHLVTHAFFKALLFLGAGSVIHAMSDEQDMRKMGGIAGKIKFTYAMMFIGSWALIGLPPFSGFYSKDVILESAFGAHTDVGMYAFWMGLGAALLTAFYSTRLLIMTFHGKPRADEHVMAHIHESPKVMLIPLLVLSIGAMGLGMFAFELFVGHHATEFWGKALFVLDHHTALDNAHHSPTWVKYSAVVVGVTGILLGIILYKVAPGIPGALANTFNRLYRFLLNKWYFDELYDKIFVKPAFALGRGLWKTGDGQLIDGVGPDGIAAGTLNIAKRVARLQTGYLYHYAFAMLTGVVLLITWYLFHSGG
jgi:NADH-quinone oxidoreductase subunit L